MNLKCKNKGFSLIEVLISIVILLVSILAAISAILGSMLLNDASNNLTTAVNDAQYVLEQINTKRLDYDSCIAQNFSCYTLPAFTNLPGETVAFDPPPTIGASITKVTVKITWQEKQQTKNFSITTYVAK